MRYRLGKGEPNRRRRRFLLLFVLLFLLGGGFAGYRIIKSMLHPQTHITQAKAVVTKIAFDDSKTKHFDESNFGIDLPGDWVEDHHDTKPYDIYSFRGTSKDSTTRILDIYEDTIPVNFSLNRAVAVESSGPKINLRGNASDNCANFTKNPTNEQHDAVHAEWQGINFLCDLANTERNVVGTISTDGMNEVTVDGTLAGQHKYFLVYTENSFSPNYGIFYSAIQSFQMK